MLSRERDREGDRGERGHMFMYVRTGACRVARVRARQATQEISCSKGNGAKHFGDRCVHNTVAQCLIHERVVLVVGLHTIARTDEKKDVPPRTPVPV